VGVDVLKSQDAKGERSCGKRRHECGRPNALYIADTQMGHDGSHEVEHETDSSRDSDYRPPDSNHESHCSGELAPGKQRKILEWDANRFVEHSNQMRIAPDLAEAGIRHDDREQHRAAGRPGMMR